LNSKELSENSFVEFDSYGLFAMLLLMSMFSLSSPLNYAASTEFGSEEVDSLTTF